MNAAPLLLSFRLALLTSLLLLLVAVPLAYRVSHLSRKKSSFLESLLSLPLVLPPTVLGFYLLLLMSPSQGVGAFLHSHFGLRLAFSFSGLVIGSMIYSFPFMFNPVLNAFRGLPESYEDAAAVLGKSRPEIFFRVLLPNIRPSLFSGFVMAFAHTVGEFGVVLMIGGNIPGLTRVASIAIYEEVEKLNYNAAHLTSAILLGFSFLILFVMYFINHSGQHGTER